MERLPTEPKANIENGVFQPSQQEQRLSEVREKPNLLCNQFWSQNGRPTFIVSPANSNRSSVIEFNLRSSRLVGDEDEWMNTDEGISSDDKLIPTHLETQCLTNLKVRYIVSPEVQNLLKQSSRFSTSFHVRASQPRESMEPTKVKAPTDKDESVFMESPDKT